MKKYSNLICGVRARDAKKYMRTSFAKLMLEGSKYKVGDYVRCCIFHNVKILKIIPEWKSASEFAILKGKGFQLIDIRFDCSDGNSHSWRQCCHAPLSIKEIKDSYIRIHKFSKKPYTDKICDEHGQLYMSN